MEERRTAVLLVMDGLGDRPLSELKNRTPLEAAVTPTFDRMASESQTGLMNVIGPGITPGSDAAHLALFGYDPYESYPGRGPLEAQGAGLVTHPGDVAFRSNFATIDDHFVVQDRRAGRDFSEEEGIAFQKALDGLVIEDIKVHFIHTVEHRGAVVLEGPGLSPLITDVDPHEAGLKLLECRPKVPAAEKTARIVNKFIQATYEHMKDLEVNKERVKRGLPPANVVLLRGQGQHKDSPTLTERYGIKCAVIAGGALYIGAAKYVGMEHVPVEGQTGTISTNFHNIGAKVVECVDKYDYIFVHIKATDNAGHDHNAEEKILAIERTDKMVGEILEQVGPKIVMIVTGDHSTPVSVGEHTCDPVPVLLWGYNIRPDSVTSFSELAAASGALHTILGKDVLPLLLGYTGRIEKFGA